ncbi:hypothetical protein [Cohnella thermotolerans]|uniref:hypothetical protein n=1 Tax=Cohnella thermotolerans TaxID=329858 RepID=UPI00041C2EB7|nr:hypothetical protein [Cohnella thermotolerans]
MNRFGKHSALTVAVLSLLLMGTACSNDNHNNNSAASSPSASAPASVSPSASDSVSDPATVGETKEGTGTYNGQIDNHSIEIEFNGQPTAFQIDSNVSDQIADWDEGAAVKFQYKENTVEADGQQVKQLTIVAIEKQ